ncbi:MAG: sterol desaturase family protein, partial [Acidimicrobiales bacterium]
MRSVVVASVAFAVMEPVSYASHRWVMHGAGWVLHRSHHRDNRERRDRFEANDWFPVIFAGATVTAMAVGTRVPAARLAVPAAVGVTAYGAAYAFVHDVYIHRRLGRLPSVGLLERLGEAHALHHRFGGEPYGMLLPVVPRAV